MIDLITLAAAMANGGGGGSSDYTQLFNKPQINGVTLTGDKSAEDIGLGKYEIELFASQDMRHLTDIQHGGVSMTFAEVKTAIETKNADIFINLGGDKSHFAVQVVGENYIIVTTNTPSPISGLQAVIRIVLDSDISDSSVEFIDVENTATEVVTESAPTEITLADNTEYDLMNVSELTFAYPSGRFECYIDVQTVISGTVNISFPSGTRFIGTPPAFGNDEKWEISIKNSIVIAQKVGEAT